MTTSQYAFTLILTIGFSGIALCWFGGVVAALTALGSRRWAWGVLNLLLGPLTGIVYSYKYPEAEYAKSLIVKGVGIILLSLTLLGLYQAV